MSTASATRAAIADLIARHGERAARDAARAFDDAAALRYIEQVCAERFARQLFHQRVPRVEIHQRVQGRLGCSRRTAERRVERMLRQPRGVSVATGSQALDMPTPGVTHEDD